MSIDSEISSFSHDKRGMSPLIATVLLIAFAVALGTMIISWGSTLGEGTGPDCSTITMIINPYLCYADNMIKMSIKNTGKAVEAVTIKISDKYAVNEILLKNSKLGPGGLLKRDIPYERTDTTYVGVIPHVEYRGEVVPCPSPVIEEGDLPEC